MYSIGFDNEKYLRTQSEHIHKRINEFGNKLYMEFGGKLFDDYHASRVLPGFKPSGKIQMMTTMADELEIVMVINAFDIERNKIRSDNGIPYEDDVLRLMDELRAMGLLVSSVVITHFMGQDAAKQFKRRLEGLGITVYRHYLINDYPTNVPLILSDKGFGKNDYIRTTRPLVVVTGPGASSGKMAVCLSQLYNELARGVKAGYAKFETFPIWNLPLKHPVNLAYEAATTNLSDVNMIDPFHLEAYGESAVNYNRDIEVFPILNTIFTKIWGYSPYKSPTDMGVNMAGFCVSDDEVCRYAAKQEIIRRYYHALCEDRIYSGMEKEIQKLELIMNGANLTVDDRAVVQRAREKAEACGVPSVAIELPDGQIFTGKTSPLLGASSAALLNVLKHLAGIKDEVFLISPSIIEPIQQLKVDYLGNTNPRLHTDELLIALSICTATNPIAKLVLEQIPRIKNSEAHSTVILSRVDLNIFNKLGINITSEPKYQHKKLYYKR